MLLGKIVSIKRCYLINAAAHKNTLWYKPCWHEELTNHMQLMFPLGMNLIFPRTPAYTQKQEVKRLARHAAVCDADALSRSMFFAGFLSSRWVNMLPWDVSQKTTFYLCISHPRQREQTHSHCSGHWAFPLPGIEAKPHCYVTLQSDFQP